MAGQSRQCGAGREVEGASSTKLLAWGGGGFELHVHVYYKYWLYLMHLQDCFLGLIPRVGHFNNSAIKSTPMPHLPLTGEGGAQHW